MFKLRFSPHSDPRYHLAATRLRRQSAVRAEVELNKGGNRKRASQSSRHGQNPVVLEGEYTAWF